MNLKIDILEKNNNKIIINKNENIILFINTKN